METRCFEITRNGTGPSSLPLEKPVAPGKYTVFIEAAREHGTYQVMHHEMDFNGAPAKVDLKGNTEIAGTSLDYHKIATR